MGKIIQHSVRLHCPVHQAFAMFTDEQQLRTWLCAYAEVEPLVGGKYELFWDASFHPQESTSGCTITGIEPDKFLSFEWKGPGRFGHLLEQANPPTSVLVFFIPGDELFSVSTDVYLVHTGWQSSAEWEEARRWFERAWREAFEELARQVNEELWSAKGQASWS